MGTARVSKMCHLIGMNICPSSGGSVSLSKKKLELFGFFPVLIINKKYHIIHVF